MAFSLDDVERITDEGDHFKVHSSSGKRPIILGKLGLHPDIIKEVQKLCAGGQVRSYDTGGSVEGVNAFNDPTPVSLGPVEMNNAGQVVQVSPTADSSTTGTAAPSIGPDLLTSGVAPDNTQAVNYASNTPPNTPTDNTSAINDAALAVANATKPVTTAKPNVSTGGTQGKYLSGSADEKTQEQAATTESQNNAVEIAAQKAAIATRNATNDAIDRKYETDLATSKAQMAADRQAYLTGKVDPNDFWKSIGGGDALMTGLGVVLSGIGSGLQGGGAPNLALNILQKRIETNIDLQKEAILRSKAAVDWDADQIKEVGLEFDKRKAMALSKFADTIEGAANAKAGANNSPELQKQLVGIRQTADQLNQTRVQAQATLAKTKADTSLAYAQANKANADAVKTRTEGPKGVLPVQVTKSVPFYDKKTNSYKYHDVTESGIAPTDQAKELNDADSKELNAAHSLTAYQSALAANPNGGLYGADATTLQNARHQAAVDFLIAQSPSGRMPTPAAIKVQEDLMSDPGSFLSRTATNSAPTAVANMRQALEDRRQARRERIGIHDRTATTAQKLAAAGAPH